MSLSLWRALREERLADCRRLLQEKALGLVSSCGEQCSFLGHAHSLGSACLNCLRKELSAAFSGRSQYRGWKGQNMPPPRFAGQELHGLRTRCMLASKGNLDLCFAGPFHCRSAAAFGIWCFHEAGSLITPMTIDALTGSHGKRERERERQRDGA